MPVTWDVSGDLLVVTLTGSFEISDIVRVRTEVLGDSRFRPGLSLLLDARLSEADTSAKRIQDYYALEASLIDVGLSKRWALVVRKDSVVRYGMARMLSAYLAVRGVEMLVTRDFDEAFRALGRSGDEPTLYAGEDH